MATEDNAIYCLRCKQFTANVRPPETVLATNGRPILRAQCAECSSAKSQFTSTAK